jgi:DNA ligase 1
MLVARRAPGQRHNGAVLFADVVTTSATVAATRSRTAKIDALTELLRALGVEELAPTVGFLTGTPRQGRIGVGWASVSTIDAAPAPEPNVTIADLDAAIDALAGTRGEGSTAARQAILVALLERATADEAAFIRRLLTGELRQGALEGLMGDAAARANDVKLADFRRALMLDGDLGRVATLARTGGREALAAVRLEPLRPVLPMLASSAPDVHDALARTGLASVEWKLDGARVQVHRLGDDVRVFTRNRNDVTHRLDDVVAAAMAFPSADFVLDGEALGLDDEDRPQRFQDSMSSFGADAARPGATRLRALFFDCLRRDGVDLLDEPLVRRREHLAELVGEAAVPAITTDDPEVAATFLAEAIATGHEGVMVKAIGSPYEAGRRGKAWVKLKPVHTLDLVVLGVEWGHGRRRGWLSNLHLGARDADGGLVMVGKTFKGLTDELLTWQTERLQQLVVDERGHTVFVRPELVVEIAVDGVQTSTRYPGGVALRFARVRRYREDKAPEDADTIEAVRALLG